MTSWGIAAARLGFGSCNCLVSLFCSDGDLMEGKCPMVEQTMWDPIEKRDYTAWSWLGDSVYMDVLKSFNMKYHPGTPERVEKMYELQKKNEGYKKLLDKEGLRIHGIYDDHEFVNDATAKDTCPVNVNDATDKDTCNNVSEFKNFIGNPEYNHFPDKGVYTFHRYNIGGAHTEIILLDGRTFLQPYGTSTDGFGMLGKVQWEWLTNRLKKANEDKVDFIVIGSGTQILDSDKQRWLSVEAWEGHKADKVKLVELLSKLDSMYPPLLVSGDIHMGEVRVTKPGCVAELTTSGLTHSWFDNGPLVGVGSNYWTEHIYGIIVSFLSSYVMQAVFMFFPTPQFYTLQRTFGEIGYDTDAKELYASLMSEDGELYRLVIPKRDKNTPPTCTLDDTLPTPTSTVSMVFRLIGALLYLLSGLVFVVRHPVAGAGIVGLVGVIVWNHVGGPRPR